MTHIIVTPTQEHTAGSDEEIVQVVIHLLGRGEQAIAIMKDQAPSELATDEITRKAKDGKN